MQGPTGAGRLTARPPNVGAGATGCTKLTAPASASITASQNRWASCSPRSTDTHPTRSCRPAASIQERSNIVLPLPAGAHTSTTPPPSGADKRSNSASRWTSLCAAASGCGLARRVSRPPSITFGMPPRVRAPGEASHNAGRSAVRRNPQTEPPIQVVPARKGANRDDAARPSRPSMSRGARDRGGASAAFPEATPVAGLRVVGPPLGQAFDKRCAGKISHFWCHAPRPIPVSIRSALVPSASCEDRRTASPPEGLPSTPTPSRNGGDRRDPSTPDGSACGRQGAREDHAQTPSGSVRVGGHHPLA